jgi:hypothetical protein
MKPNPALLSGQKSANKQVLSMKTKFLLAIAMAALAPATLAATLNDDFNGSSINSALWSIHHPSSDSSAVEGGGVVTVLNRGGLITKDGFSGPIEISGRFAITGNVHDLFTFVIGTTGSSLPTYGTFSDGMRFNWLKMTDGGQIVNVVSIDQITGGNPATDTNLALGTFNFAFDQFYDFKITDNGSVVSLYFDDLNTPLLTGTSSLRPGNKVGFYNREGAGAGSSISDGSEVQVDYLSISTVPEPSALGLFAVAFVSLALFKRNRTIAKTAYVITPPTPAHRDS